MKAPAPHAAAPLHRRVDIDDGRWVSIRPIQPADALGLSDLYDGLSLESRRRRFLGSAPMPTDRLVARFARAGHGLVAVLGEPGPRDGAVVGHATVHGDGRGDAEVAFAVADELQGHGIGRALVDEAVQLARACGVRRLSATLFAENVPMRRLLRGARCPILTDHVEAGIEEITLAVEAA